MPTNAPMNLAAVVAAEYEQRLSHLLTERLGRAEGGLMRRVDPAALYLPNDLAARVRQLVVDLAALSSGRAEADNMEKFRASAEAMIAAVAAVLPTGKPQERMASPRQAVFWHLLIALAAPFVGISLNYAMKIHTPLLVSVLLFWIWGGYLYWVIDRIVKLWLPPSATRGGLRTFVAFLFFWCPVALGWALLKFIDWRRRYAARHVGYERRLSPQLLEDGRAIDNLNQDTGAYIGNDGYTLTPTPFKSSI